MKQLRCVPAALLAVAMALSGSPLLAQSPASAPLAQPPASAPGEEAGWSFSFAPYFWASGMEGEASFKGLPPQPVEASFGDVLSNLDFALLGAFEARHGRFGFGTDLIYMNLGATIPLPDVLGQREPGVDMRQLLTEGDFLYRVLSRESSHGAEGFVDLIGGVRYNKVSAQLETSVLPDTKRSFGWFEPVLGVRGLAPLSKRFAVAGRVDSAISSEVSWQVLGDLRFRLSEHWRLGAGYRYAESHYDEGEGTGRKLWSMTIKGPYVGAQVEW